MKSMDEKQQRELQLFFLKEAQKYNRRKNAKRKERKKGRQNAKAGRQHNR